MGKINITISTALLFMIFVITLTSCTSNGLSTFTSDSATPTSKKPVADKSMTTWDTLQPLSSAKLINMQKKTQDPIENGWIQLALITKQKNKSSKVIAGEVLTWRYQHPSHPATALLPDNNTLKQLQSDQRPKQIAVLLPHTGPYRHSGQLVREGILNAYYTHGDEAHQQRIKFYDTAKAQNMRELYQQALTDGADFVIGPLMKENVAELSQSGPLPTPVLALNYSPSEQKPEHFFEFGLLPEDEIQQLITRARLASYSRAIVIAPDNAWGKRLVSAFSTRWEKRGGKIQATWLYGDKTQFNQQIAALLEVNPVTDKRLMQEDNDKTTLAQQRRQDIDVIFLFAQSQDARLIVPLLRFYYANNIPVYATASVYAMKGSREIEADLNGVIICDTPWSLQQARSSSVSDIAPDRLYALGQDAYMLSESMTRLTTLPHFPVYGSTGALLLTSQQIHRRLPCMAIRNG